MEETAPGETRQFEYTAPQPARLDKFLAGCLVVNYSMHS